MEEDLLEFLEYNFQKVGFETIGFLNTKIVTQILDEEEIDLLIIDRNLPGVEGSELVHVLREDWMCITFQIDKNSFNL